MTEEIWEQPTLFEPPVESVYVHISQVPGTGWAIMVNVRRAGERWGDVAPTRHNTQYTKPAVRWVDRALRAALLGEQPLP